MSYQNHVRTKIGREKMTIQNIHKNIVRQRKIANCFKDQEIQKNQKITQISKFLNFKILKFQDNYIKPNLPQGLEQYYKVTPCNEKCNFFILLSFILLKSITLNTVLLRRDGVSPSVFSIYYTCQETNHSQYNDL